MLVMFPCAALVAELATDSNNEAKAAESPLAGSPPQRPAAAEEPIMPPIELKDPPPTGGVLDPKSHPDAQNVQPIEPGAGSDTVPGGDRIHQTFARKRWPNYMGFDPMPLAGITLYPDLRSLASEPAKQWEKEDKDALGAGVQLMEGLQTPDPGDLRPALGKYLDKTVTFEDLQEMVRIIEDHYRKHNRPMTQVYIPKQSLFSDRVVIGIVEGRVGKSIVLTVADLAKKRPDQLTPAEKSFIERMRKEKNWWNSWYGNPYRAEDIGTVFHERTSQLEKEKRVLDTEEIKALVAGVNRSPWARLDRPEEHPFRNVTVNFSQPAENVIGTTNLVFEVDDKRPLKFFTGVDNSLTEMTGDNRFFLGVAWYDAFLLGRNHQLGAQVFSSLSPDEMLGFSLNYQIPWQDRKFNQFTEFFTSYATSTAQVMLGGIQAQSGGSNLIFGGRHYLELPGLFGAVPLSQPLMDQRPHKWAKPEREAMGLHHEVGIGIDYKISDNNLLFGGTTVAQSPADIVQLDFEYNARQTDPTGETTLSAQLYYSPGNITSNNTDLAFNPLRQGATADYFYTRLHLEREQDLPFTGSLSGMMVRAALTGQYSSANLLASEQLGLGGFGSVRGYPERVLRGDIGWILNLELYSPEFHPSRDWFNFNVTDTLRFLAFVDYAHGESVKNNPADPLDDPADLLSAGLGLRYEFNDALRIRLDYGFRFMDLPAAADNNASGGAHFGLTYVF